MSKFNRYSVYSVMLIFVAMAVDASEHAGYWRQITPKGKSYKCQGVYSESQLIDVLDRAGWSVNKSIPRIDWDINEAVVVSPSEYYKNGRMVFYGLIHQSNTALYTTKTDNVLIDLQTA